MAEGIRSPEAPRELGAPAEIRALGGEPRWRNGSSDSWWLTVFTKEYCAHARLRRGESGRWTGFASRPDQQGWLHDDDIDAGESLIKAIRIVERAIARLSASAC